MPDPRGLCYVHSYDVLLKRRSGLTVLVHGAVPIDGKLCPHGWLERDAGHPLAAWYFETALGLDLGIESNLRGAERYALYSLEEARAFVLGTGNCGPWDDRSFALAESLPEFYPADLLAEARRRLEVYRSLTVGPAPG